MLGALSSTFRSILWALNVALAIIILAVTVAPISATTNMASWLTMLGFTRQANWLIEHAQAGLHFTAHSLIPSSECTRSSCVPQAPAFDLTFSEITLVAVAGIVVCSALLWLVPKIGRLVHGVTDRFDIHAHRGHA